MIATSSQPGAFPVASSNNPLTLVHTLPPPGSATVTTIGALPSTSALEVVPVPPELRIPVVADTSGTGKKSYPCMYCEKTFGSRYNVRRHEKGCKLAPAGSGGNAAQAEPITCPSCDKVFQTRDGMTRHLKKKCKLGGMAIVPFIEEGQGTQRWTGKKMHFCKYCGKQFSTKWNAIRHENLFHTSDEPPLTTLMVVPVQSAPTEQCTPGKPERYCRFCGNYFSTKYNAIRHEKICTRISGGAGSQEAGTSTVESKTTDATAMIESAVSTVEIQTQASQNVQQQQQPPPQTAALQQQQQQIILHQQRPPQAQQLITQQLQLQQVQQQQQQVSRQQQQIQQQQQHEVQQNHQQEQIIIQQHRIQQQQHAQQQVLQHQHQQQQQQQQQHQQQPQQVHISPQQVVFVQPFHVCKFCNKQLDSKCDPTPILRDDLQNGTINTAQLQAASLQVQAPIASTVLAGVSLPAMLATIPTHNITIPIQAHTPQQQRVGDQQQQQVLIQQQPQQVQHQQVQLQLQPVAPQQVVPRQLAQQQQRVAQRQIQPQPQPGQIQSLQAQIQTQPQQQMQVQQVQHQQQMQPPPQTPRQAPQVPQQSQAPPAASPGPSSLQQKPHGCKFCTKHFATKWYLDQHEKIHTGQAVTCNVCNKSFVTRWHLDKHVRVHMPGGKKAKRDSDQDSARYRNTNIIPLTESGETPQRNNISGAQESMVVGMPSFSMASDSGGQMQQFTLSPLTQQQQGEK